MDRVYLRNLLEDVGLRDTDGSKTFADLRSFTDSTHGIPVPPEARGKERKATKVTISELVSNGTLREVFSSKGDGRKRWTEHQMVEFCESHHDKFTLRGYFHTFFEMEGSVIAAVNTRPFFGCKEPYFEVYLLPFSSGEVWYAECANRFIFLQ